MTTSKTSIDGLTIIELLVVTAIFSILVSFSIPTYTHIREKQVADLAITSIYEMYQLSRYTAVREQSSIIYCGSNSQNRCEKQFSRYLLVFIDDNNDKKPDQHEIVHVRELELNGGYIKLRSAFGKEYAILHPSGAASLQGSMIFCPKNREPRFANRVTWNKAGRPYKGRDRNRDGYIDDINADAIDCNAAA